MFQSIHSFGDFKVYPAVSFIFMELVFVDEILWDVREFNSDILWAIKWSAEVKVADVVACKFGGWAGNDTVDEEV